LHSQLVIDDPIIPEDYQLSSEQYITNDLGQVFMKVHIWGALGTTGTHSVYEGIDFASLISLVGGPSEFANLKKIRLYREKPDENGQLVYQIDLTPFLKTGDRSNFIQIKPNDTIIIPKKLVGSLLAQIGTIQTLFSAITLFIQLNTLYNSQ
tara:strand:- start:623 stop:1078 length:456 start_codon:yes stop_codon:yes gene_type:complete